MAMDFSQLNKHYSPKTPFIKPHVVAPRQVIGFNLSPKPEIRPNEGALNQCLEVTQGKIPSSYRGATSPRSALQELLKSPAAQSKSPSSPPSANQNWGTISAEKGSTIGSHKQNSTNQQLHDGLGVCNLQIKDSKEPTAVLALHRTRAAGFAAVLEDPIRCGIKQRLNSVIIKGKLSSVNEVKNHQSSSSSRGGSDKSRKSSLFMFVGNSPTTDPDQYIINRSMDFLHFCHLCRRSLLQGQDVFMYSGDKAFCSMECRYQQIVIDERKERCPPAVIRSGADNVNYSSITKPHQHTHTHPHHAPSLLANNTGAAAA